MAQTTQQAPAAPASQAGALTTLPPLCPPRPSNNSISSSFTRPTTSTNAIAISKLLSPPELDQLDTFSAAYEIAGKANASQSQQHAGNGLSDGGEPIAEPVSPVSLPTSPNTENTNAVTAAPDTTPDTTPDTVRDPILYPASSDTSPAASQARPLFEDHSAVDHAVSSPTLPAASSSPTLPAAVSSPTLPAAISSPTLPAAVSSPIQPAADHQVAEVTTFNLPTTEEPRLFRLIPESARGNTVCFQSVMMSAFMADPRGWRERELEQLKKDSRASAEHKRRLECSFTPTPKPSFSRAPRVASPHSAKLPHLHQEPQKSSSRLQKQKATHSGYELHLSPIRATTDNNHRVTKRTGHTAAVSRTIGTPARIAPHVRGTLHSAQNDNNDGRAPVRLPGTLVEPRVRTVAPNREDKDFRALPDYSPPLSTLPERTNNLKVEWKGNALDLSSDPNREFLHRDELGLAASLRLDCATYLTSKRRIFIRRLECAKINKEFRKTDAQQACKIDVNKASKLWTAYEKVGWLRIEHMRGHF